MTQPLDPSLQFPGLADLLRECKGDVLAAARLLGYACPHCGNVVIEQGACPMKFPRPECLTMDAALLAHQEARLKGKKP